MIHLENKTIAFAWELSDEILKAIEEGQVPDKITYAYYDDPRK